MLHDPALFSVATGAFKSPAFWQVAEKGRYASDCPFCGKLFKSKNTLANHKSLYHKGQTLDTQFVS